MQRRFEILDVFTDKVGTGNQLAVVYDSEGLSSVAMQSIAAEFNFSETVFLEPATDGRVSAKVRIFTPRNELPFAGHPTVGAAICVARQIGIDGLGQGIVILEEQVGDVRCGVRFEENTAYAEFDLPKIAERVELPGMADSIPLALGLSREEIGFESHVVTQFDAGLPYTLVPVRNLDVAGRAKPVMAHWNDAFGSGSHNSAYVYCRDTIRQDANFHARMFAPDAGIPEDPATGSAVASIAGAIALFDQPRNGWTTVKIEQGVEMGRESLITLELQIENDVFVAGRIGGNAVVFAKGTIDT